MLRISWNGEWREIPLAETDVTEIGEGHFLVTIENRQVEVFALPDGRLSDGLALDGTELKIETERERIIRERFQQSGPSGTVRMGTHVVKAPMPGLVRSIKVQQGDAVERATTVVVLEAMKMENSILAGAKGRIKTVFATEGNSVEKNAPLLEIESA
ncbi:MAG TPA: biotin/lipoyl-containing protein [Candidatus Kapabacteria bacterium]